MAQNKNPVNDHTEWYCAAGQCMHTAVATHVTWYCQHNKDL